MKDRLLDQQSAGRLQGRRRAYRAQVERPTLVKEHGGPARLIIPKRYAWKGAKFIREIVFLDRDILGFWEVRGYSNTADPWAEDRFA